MTSSVANGLSTRGHETERDETGLLLAIFVLDRISGAHRPQVPGMFERACAAALA